MRRPIVAAGAWFVAGALAVSGVLIAEAGDADPGHYQVDAADSWQSIAAAHGLTADELQVANNVAASTSNTAHPRTGWVLHIPEVAPSTTTTTTTAPATTTTTQPATTTTVAPTTTAPPATTTTAPVTTTSTLPPTTSSTSPPVTTQPPSGVQFSEDFSTSAGFYDRFDFGWSQHQPDKNGDGDGADPGESEDIATQSHLTHSWLGDHNHDCSPPDTSPNQFPDRYRTIEIHPGMGPITPQQVADQTSKAQTFWWCAPGNDAAKGHLMTGMSGEAYVIAWFSPKQTFTDVSRVCWDQNTTTMDSKWTNVVIAPLSDVAAATAYKGFLDLGFDPPGHQPANNGNPATQGPTTDLYAANGVGVRVQNGNMSYWQGNHYIGGEELDQWYQNPDRATRYRHCLIDNGNGTVTATQDRPAQCNIRNGGMTTCGHRERTFSGAFPNGQVRVVFHDDQYDPVKRGGYDPTRQTWHFDQIEIQ